MAALPITDRRIDPAAFDTPPESRGDIVPDGRPQQTSIAVHDGVISAQLVAVARDEARILQKLRVMAAAAGEAWFYRFPVKSKGRQEWIEGPSTKLANDLARIYGNCQVDVRAIDQGASWMFYARFVDIETGYSLTRAFQQPKDAARLGGDDRGRKENIAFQIGQSKATRNVIVNALQTLADFAFEEARANLVEKVGKSLDRYRDKVTARLAELNVDVARVEAVVGRAVKDWLAPDVARIIAELQAIGDGMASAADLYPGAAPPPPNTPRPTRADAKPAATPGGDTFPLVDQFGEVVEDGLRPLAWFSMMEARIKSVPPGEVAPLWDNNADTVAALGTDPLHASEIAALRDLVGAA